LNLDFGGIESMTLSVPRVDTTFVDIEPSKLDFGPFVSIRILDDDDQSGPADGQTEVRHHARHLPRPADHRQLDQRIREDLGRPPNPFDKRSSVTNGERARNPGKNRNSDSLESKPKPGTNNRHRSHQNQFVITIPISMILFFKTYRRSLAND